MNAQNETHRTYQWAERAMDGDKRFCATPSRLRRQLVHCRTHPAALAASLRSLSDLLALRNDLRLDLFKEFESLMPLYECNSIRI